MLRHYLLCLYLTLCGLAYPVFSVQAQDAETVDIEIINRANELRELLDHLLLDSNDSSIQKIIKEGNEPTRALAAEALKLKSRGEQLLAEEKYLEAAVSLQSSLDYVFKAIRQPDEQAEPPDALNARLTEHTRVNDTFITTATRVIRGKPDPEAMKLLESAKAARHQADADSSDGKSEAALVALEHSTRLAQQAIMKVRNGQIIERGQ